MNGIAFVTNPLNLAYGFCKKRIEEHQRIALIAFVVSVSLAAVTFIYRRLQSSHVIPFNRWDVSLGLSSQPGLTQDEAKDLEKSSRKYSPVEFARRLNAYVLQHRKPASPSEKPKTHQEWLQWMCSATSDAVVKEAKPILPTYQERLPITQEDEQAHAIQTWAMSLQPLFALIKDNPFPWKELLQPIQSSPRLAYTILFNCIAPFVAKAIWDGVHDFLPNSILEIGNRYLEHKGKIALVGPLVGLGLLLWLYYRMNQERGIITNLTDNYASSRIAHKALDLVPSYRAGLEKLFRSIGTTNPGDNGANIIWFYDEDIHSTFVGKIGEILGEMTATGRIYESSDLLSQFPQLKNLKVIEISLKHFLTEYRNPDEVYRGWNDTLKHLVKSPNTLVILKDIDAIKPFFLASRQHMQKSDESSEIPRGMQNEKSPGNILADLIFLSLHQGKFRCLIEFSEQDKRRMEKDSKDFNLFSAIRSPDINAKELKELCRRLYTAPDTSCSFSKEEIGDLFTHLEPFLSSSSLPPLSILDTLQNALREKASSWRLTITDQVTIRTIEKAEKALNDVQQMKDHLLQKLWLERGLQQAESLQLAQALLLIENILIPLYKNAVVASKDQFLMSSNLVDAVQKRFKRMFGPCTVNEGKKLQTLPERIKKEIKGQDLAVQAVCDAVYRWRKVPPLDGKPLVLFFAGESGVGKSQTATKLAYELNSIYGIMETAVKTHESNVKRINLNRKSQNFLGWDKIKAEILCHLLYEPTSVVILEEWDKMERDEKSNLLELLDGTSCHLQEPWGYGSTNGPVVDKSSSIFILTSNVSIGESPEKAVDTIKEGITSCFSEEKAAQAFLSRIDALIPFQKIAEKESQTLIEEYLNEYVKKKILPEGKREAVKALLPKDMPTDVRKLQRLIQKAIFEETALK